MSDHADGHDAQDDHSSPARRTPGACRGQFTIAEDFDELPPGLFTGAKRLQFRQQTSDMGSAKLPLDDVARLLDTLDRPAEG